MSILSIGGGFRVSRSVNSLWLIGICMLAIDKSDVGCVCNNGVVVCKVDGGEAEDGGSRTGNEEEGICLY